MRQLLGVAVCVLVVVLALWGMRRGWRRRSAATAPLVAHLPEQPAELGARRAEPVEATYVSTTRAGDWLDRVAAADLGVRSPASVEVYDAGVQIRRTGARDVFIPATALRAAATAPGIAGKVVAGDGLVVLTWQADADDARGLDTGLRPRHAADRPRLVAAVTDLITTTPGAAGAQES